MNRLPQKVSLVAQTTAVILDEIESGRWTGSLPGEHDLCAQLHVSRKTLRSALDHLSRTGILKCSHGKRRTIVERATFRPPTQGNRVLLLMPEPMQAFSPFVLFLIDRLRQHLTEAGYALETHASRIPFRGKTSHGLETLAKTFHPAGWVLLQSTQAMQRWFSERTLPCVVVGSRYEGIQLPSVDRDYDAVCQHAVNQFINRGHKRVALLVPKAAAAGDIMTIESFRKTIAKASSVGVQGVVCEHDGSVPGICGRVDSLITRAQRPTAFLVCRAHHVLTVLGHLLNSSIHVPEDVALISRDDDSFLDHVLPTVARYSHNQTVFAAKLSRVVIEMLRGEMRIDHHNITPVFLPGRTLE